MPFIRPGMKKRNGMTADEASTAKIQRRQTLKGMLHSFGIHSSGRRLAAAVRKPPFRTIRFYRVLSGELLLDVLGSAYSTPLKMLVNQRFRYGSVDEDVIYGEMDAKTVDKGYCESIKKKVAIALKTVRVGEYLATRGNVEPLTSGASFELSPTFSGSSTQ